jgi:hypothetical protein
MRKGLSIEVTLLSKGETMKNTDTITITPEITPVESPIFSTLEQVSGGVKWIKIIWNLEGDLHTNILNTKYIAEIQIYPEYIVLDMGGNCSLSQCEIKKGNCFNFDSLYEQLSALGD